MWEPTGKFEWAPYFARKKKMILFCTDNDYVKFFKIFNMEPA